MCFYWGKFNAEMVVAKLAAMGGCVTVKVSSRATSERLIKN